ncbi:uncharacterized protein LOC112568744 [Pomacea canaliculata]|uniref:uncharacterized protein LOC112568744 n=1 Tax=Pomacea canaliculata TaxID=400727 RepID=UPI000D737EB3|nr:uncharacterized protein LOC112568744 [Pomacea canaliculata]
MGASAASSSKIGPAASSAGPGYCRCTDDARGSAILYRQFKQPGRSVYIWSWSDSVRKKVSKKAQISFDVQDDNGSTHDSTVTSTSGSPTAAGGDNLNVIFVTSATTAAVIIVPIIIIISVYVYRRRRGQATRHSNYFRYSFLKGD